MTGRLDHEWEPDPSEPTCCIHCRIVRYEEIPGYVCGQIEALADAWERDRAMARGYMDERDEAREEATKMQRWAEEAAAAENASTRELVGAKAAERATIVAWLRREHHPDCDWRRKLYGSPACTCGQWLIDERAAAIAAGAHNDPKAAPSGDR